KLVPGYHISSATTLENVRHNGRPTCGATTTAAGRHPDNGPHPGARLGQGSRNAPAAGAWNDVSISAVQVTSGTQYWIALLGPSGAGTVRFRDHGSGGSALVETSSQSTLTALPSTWATGWSGSDGPASIWGGGAGPSGPPPDQ